MPELNANQITSVVEEAEKAIRDGAYVAVGLGVLAVQRAAVGRRELAARIDRDPRLGDAVGSLKEDGLRQWNELAAQVGDLLHTVDGFVAPARQTLEEQVDAMEAKLPASARNVVGSLRAAAEQGAAQVRSAVGLDPRPATPAR